jgi:hypothetical protein
MSQESCFRRIRPDPIETLMLVWQRLLVAFCLGSGCYFWRESSPYLETDDPRSTQTERWDMFLEIGWDEFRENWFPSWLLITNRNVTVGTNTKVGRVRVVLGQICN